jgi:hypothetical protein
MAAMREPQTFEEFWPYYVSQHRNKTTRQLHFIGTSLALGCVAISPFYPKALIAAPIVGYGFAWIGHFAFEKNKPASWNSLKHAAWSLRGDLKMWKKMLDGTMDAEVEVFVPIYEASEAAMAAAAS